MIWKIVYTWMDWSNIQIFSCHSSWKIPSYIRIVILNILLIRSLAQNTMKTEPPGGWAFFRLTLTIRVMISEVEIPSVLSVAQNISFDFGSAYVSEKGYESWIMNHHADSPETPPPPIVYGSSSWAIKSILCSSKNSSEYPHGALGRITSTYLQCLRASYLSSSVQTVLPEKFK